ncbi:aldehyde dehydrogenase family protein [Streptomyces sp. NPDC020875]|uniref:aldehyde dehydrogenase family protein n=1 Tax=Streptomyces sp. NPDC020875 TaxID=3154898 RepID=UPI0033D9A3A8
MSGSLPAVDPVIGGRDVPSRDRAVLTALDGTPLATVGLAPRLLAQAAFNRMRAADPAPAPVPELFAAAGELFATAELAGESPETYRRRVVLATGTPYGAIARAVGNIGNSLGMIDRINRAELPAPFAVPGCRTVWVPRGALLAAVVPNNHPEPNVTWVRALAMGARVLVRPGSKDPFTPRRLVTALLAAGLDPDTVAFLPGDHESGENLLARADLGLVYGGPAAAARFGHRNDVLVRGPGRSKVLLGPGDQEDEELLDDLAGWISDDGGVRCNNISLVLTSGSVHDLAEALAERLAALPVRPVTDERAALPALGPEHGKALADHAVGLAAAHGARDHSSHRYGGAPLADPGDGTVVLRPLVISVDRADAPPAGTELGFPFVVVAPWRPADGVAPLRNSLVVGLPGEHAELAGAVLREPTVRKVVTGRVRPWSGAPETPHDGSLAQFLLEPKGLITAETEPEPEPEPAYEPESGTGTEPEPEPAA